jgi:hypothetical protein
MATHLLEGFAIRGMGSQQTVSTRERLVALGTVTAGLTHELNNPATAVGRAGQAPLSPLEASDREDELGRWLEERGVDAMDGMDARGRVSRRRPGAWAGRPGRPPAGAGRRRSSSGPGRRGPRAGRPGRPAASWPAPAGPGWWW